AAFCFNPAEDPIATTLQKKLEDEGLDAVLNSASGIQATEPLAGLVRERYQVLREKGF
ncbi:MAG: hypothetical protein IH586_22125, partial [Anaerolineaceae bacterium]|nr:hypothetical protein [Anaerolineaceae bacterium]